MVCLTSMKIATDKLAEIERVKQNDSRLHCDISQCYQLRKPTWGDDSHSHQSSTYFYNKQEMRAAGFGVSVNHARAIHLSSHIPFDPDVLAHFDS
jgi:hypothetical protein